MLSLFAILVIFSTTLAINLNSFEKLASILSSGRTVCEQNSSEDLKSFSIPLCQKNKSCLPLTKKEYNFNCISFTGMTYKVSTKSNSTFIKEKKTLRIVFDVKENYIESFASINTRDPVIYIEFIINFEGLNTINKYGMATRAIQVIYFYLIRNGYRLTRSSERKEYIKEYLQNEGFGYIRILTLWTSQSISI